MPLLSSTRFRRVRVARALACARRRDDRLGRRPPVAASRRSRRSGAPTCRGSRRAGRRAENKARSLSKRRVRRRAGGREVALGLRQHRRHVPPSATPNTKAVLRRDESAKAVPLELEGPPRAGGQRPGTRQHRVGKPQRRSIYPPSQARARCINGECGGHCRGGTARGPLCKKW